MREHVADTLKVIVQALDLSGHLRKFKANDLMLDKLHI